MADAIHVLHVEDDPEFAAVTAQFLERENDRIEVASETDPEAALDRLATGTVDCLVSDYDMPGMDGVALLERVRDVDPMIPFILFTGKGSEEVASEALAEGATDYLQKATGTDQYALLANRIENAVVQYQSVVEYERQREILETAQEIADIGVCEIDAETGGVWLSEGIFTVFDVPRPPDGGGSFPELDHEDLVEYYHPDDRDRMQAAIESALETGEPSDNEARLDTDEERWVRVRCQSTTDESGARKVRAAIQDITDRRERDRALTRTERRFQAVFDDPEMLVGVLDPDGHLLEANETALAYVDAEFETLRGEHFAETPWWDEAARPSVREWIERAARGEYVTDEVEIEGPDGRQRRISGSFRPVFDEQDTLMSLIVSARDITQRHSSQEQRDFFETLVAETTDIIFVLDDDGVVQYASPAIETILGYEQGEYPDKTLGDRLHPDDREAVFDWYEAVVSEAVPDPDPIEHRVRHADGSWRWLEARIGARAESHLDGHVVTSRDITARKEREQELQEFEKIIEGLGESIFLVDEHGEMTHVNPGGARISGYDAEEILEGGAALLYSQADIDRMRQAILDLVDQDDDDVAIVEVEMQTKDGREVPVEATLTAQTDDGEFAGAVGVVKDIAERKETQRQLRAYESIIRALPDEISIVDVDGYHVELLPPTDSAVTTSGWHPDDLIGEHVSTIMTDADIERAGELVVEMVENDRERTTFEMDVLGKHGEMLTLENHMALVTDDDGEIQGTVNVLRDIEERKAYEQELERQNERLEEFAEIASHDLRNPLNLAQGYMEMVDAECDSEHTGRVTDALERMEQLIADTLTWARQGATVDERTPVSLATLAPDCWEAVGTDAGTLAVLEDVTVYGDANRIRRVIENLLRNAVEHGGSDVTVEIGALADGFYVADDGPGIPPAERESVFDAGMTTADDGTGFGLAIITEIVEAHGWEIDVTESDSGGARFEITGSGEGV